MATATKQQKFVAFVDGEWQTLPKTGSSFPLVIRQLVTPAWAKDVLCTRNTRNRKTKKHRIAKFARDMKAGRWRITNQGIGFDENGVLFDGQNRLEAVVLSGKAVEFFVTYGMAKDAQAVIDDVAIRTDYDVATLSGMSLTKPQISCMNYILEIKKQQNATKPERLAFYDLHEEAAAFATERIKRKYVSKAPILSVVARAYYTANTARLEQFCLVLETGQKTGPEDNAAWLLREYVLDTADEASGPARLKQYRTAQWALKHFLKGTPVVKRGEADACDDCLMFPLPEEQQQSADYVK